MKRPKQSAKQILFYRLYSWFALAVLLLSTAWWSWQGAAVQATNADQLADAYLFKDRAVFSGALFPGTHTFLLKWPLFLLVRLGNYSPAMFTAVTIGVCVLTIGGLAILLSRIERRPLMRGSWYLALASILLLVPAQLQPGTLLPVNMAMTTTRNLEYIVYLLAIVLLVQSPRLKHRRTVAALGLLTLVFASDKLFMAVAVGSGALAWVFYRLTKRRYISDLAQRWLYLSLAASILATVLLFIIDASGLTHIVGSANASPYDSSQGLHRLMLGAVYAILGLFTNFGANPVFDVTVLANIPRSFVRRMVAPSGFSFAVNGLLLVGGLALAGRFLRDTFRLPPPKKTKKRVVKPLLTGSAAVSLILLWSSLILLGTFIATDHYYAGDARYLTLWFFGLSVVAATMLRQTVIRPRYLYLFGAACGLSLVLAFPFARSIGHIQQHAYDDVTNRNQLIAQVLTQHHVSVLVGDYWRVLPFMAMRQQPSTTRTLPLESCTTPRTVLSSKAWEVDLHTHSFAYLLSLDRNLTDFPQCSIADISRVYGRPNATVVIQGSVNNPREVLLFYDQGIHQGMRQKTKTPPAASASSVIPVPLQKLRQPACQGKTIMNIVAHQDDDLLFMNPDELRDIQGGNCIRTVYITAGDAGSGKFYWLSREQGSEAAYDYMRGQKAVWEQRTVKLANRQFVTIASPRGNSTQSLVFMHVPDGNIGGTGFAASGHESLARLESGEISDIRSVDGQSSYSKDGLVTALASLITHFRPAEIRTQANLVSQEYPDHSDHMAVGRVTKLAYAQYQQQLHEGESAPSLAFYLGYPVHSLEPNVSDQDLTDKENAFFQYAQFDGGVCHNLEECTNSAVYGIYLQRQYRNEY